VWRFIYIAFMTSADIAYLRLKNQLIADPSDSIGAVTRHFGAMQAQDYAAAKWAIGLRVKNVTDSDIEQAISQKEIVRTWSLRGTLQFMHPETMRDILTLTRERMLTAYRSHFKRYELDGDEFTRIAAIIKRKLRGKQLTRAEIMKTLEEHNVVTGNMRSTFIMLRLAMEGITCHSERRGKEFTFTLLDEWLPKVAVKKSRQEILKDFTLTYFKSHGPSTISDFAWWSGLLLKDIKQTLEIVKDELDEVDSDGNKYFIHKSCSIQKRKHSAVYLLPSFDEYLLGYANRKDVLHTDHVKHVAGTNNGIFSPVIVIDGKVAATWKRTIKKDQLIVDVKPFEKLTTEQNNEILKRIKTFSEFAELRLAY